MARKSINYKVDVNDSGMWQQGLKLISSDCNLSLSVDDLYDQYLPYLKRIDKYETDLQHTLFEVEFSEHVLEYAYVLGFLLNCKEFIGNNKDAYKQIVDNQKTAYETMSELVKEVNNKNSSLKKVVSSDPYPDYLSHGNPKPVKPICPKCKKCEPCKQFKDSKSSDPKFNLNKNLLVCGIIALLFIIFSNKLVYQATDYLTSVSFDDCPTNIGILIHSLVLFCVFFLLNRYLLKFD